MDKKILNSLGDVIVVVNPEGFIEEASENIADLFVYTESELIGKPLSTLMPERFRINHAKIFEGLGGKPIQRRMGEGTGMKLVALAKDGSEFYIDIALSSYQTEDEKMHYVALIRDITDLIKVQSELENTVNKLEVKNKELEHFAYIVSHDLKAPARGTQQLVEIIEEDHIEELSADVLKYFKLIQNRNFRMIELIDGILSYSRAGVTKSYKERFKLINILHEVQENLQISENFNISFINCGLEISAYKTQFSQVLANLIGNAIKYHDKEYGNIEVSCSETIDEIEIRIKDDGPGIPEKYHQTIFEMFGTANEVSRSDSTGIGLAIVRKIIEQNSGQIQVNSEMKKGSEFIFTWKK